MQYPAMEQYTLNIGIQTIVYFFKVYCSIAGYCMGMLGHYAIKQ